MTSRSHDHKYLNIKPNFLHSHARDYIRGLEADHARFTVPTCMHRISEVVLILITPLNLWIFGERPLDLELSLLQSKSKSLL